MKAMKKLTVMALGCVASLALGCAAMNTTVASAESTADKFEMQYGVQLALKKDAMRWIVEMGQNVYDEIVTNDVDEKVSLSVVVSSKTQFDNANGDYMGIEKKTEIEIPDDMIYRNATTGCYYANAALSGIYATDQSAKELVAIGVIVTESVDGISYEYAEFNGGDMANNVRKQYDVLQQVALDTRDEAKNWTKVILSDKTPYTWFGTEDYPLVVDSEEKYEDFITQINNGFNFNVNVNLYTKYATDNVELAEGKEMPASVAKYHEVNFYKEDELLDTVEVKDGEEAVYGGKELKAYAVDLIYRNSNIGGDSFSKWVTEKGGNEEAPIAIVTDSMDVYARFTYGDVTSTLMGYAKEEEPKSLLFFDREVGFTQIGSKAGTSIPLSNENRSYDTSVKFNGENGSTKISYKDISLGDAHVNLKPVAFTPAENEYVVMHVYVDGTDGLNEVWFRMNGGKGDRVYNKQWGTLVFTAQEFASNPYFMMSLRGSSDTTETVNIYFSKAELVSGKDILDTTDTYSIGNTEFTGIYMRNYYTAAASKAHLFTPNDGIFLRDLNIHPHCIGNKLYYHDTLSKSTSESGALGLVFKNKYAYTSSKIYITASGMSAPCMQLFTGRESGHDGLGAAYPVSTRDVGNGFVEYCFDLSGRTTTKISEFGYFRLFSGNGKSAAFAQIVISDITVVTNA
ncbi:MAG: hypothetical protein IKZ28_02370 [Clostridia bacterium]|nr:hypothetical protein [Clostridia bacterium]